MARVLCRCIVALASIGASCGGGGEEVAGAPVAIAFTIGGRVATEGPVVANSRGGEEIVVRTTGGLSPGDRLHLGGVEALEATVHSGEELRARTPPLPEAILGLRLVRASGGTYDWPHAIRAIDPPEIHAIEAAEGPGAGGNAVELARETFVEIRGAGFRSGVTLRLDGAEVPLERIDASRLRFRAPARTSESAARVAAAVPEGLSAEAEERLHFSDEFSLAPHEDALTEEEARHLLHRAAFGAPAEAVARAVEEGLARTLDRLFTFVPAPAVEAEALSHYASLPPRSPVRGRDNQAWWLTLLARSPNGLRERMAFFLHDHFATSQRLFNTEQVYFMHDQIQLFRSMALGNWRDLCVAVTKDKAMLLWLDGLSSTAAAPNENFARELFELFLLGEGRGYAQRDVEEAARAFTGFRYDRAPDRGYDLVLYETKRHDAGEKTIFGVRGRFGYDDNLALDDRDVDGGVVDLTLRMRAAEASAHLARKLLDFFLREEPSPALVAELAAEVRDANWELRPVVRRILESRAFFASRTIRNRVAGPVSFAIGFLRNTGIDVPVHRVAAALEAMGQSPLEPPGVDGWPSGAAWLGEQQVVERANFLRSALLSAVAPPPGADLVGEALDAVARRIDARLDAAARADVIAHLGIGESHRLSWLTEETRAFVVRELHFVLGLHPSAHRR